VTRHRRGNDRDPVFDDDLLRALDPCYDPRYRRSAFGDAADSESDTVDHLR